MDISLNSVHAAITIPDMTSQLNKAFDKANTLNICDFLINPCGYGYMCEVINKNPACQERCFSNTFQCSNDGECYIDYKYNNLKCRCRDTNEYVYIGDKCEVAIRKVQAFSLSPKDYAIIAGTTAGAVVFIIIVVNLIKCLRKRDKRENCNDDLNIRTSDLNVAEASVHLSQMKATRNIKDTLENNAYLHAYGLPEISKDQRVYRDPHTGEEALIYQPVNVTRPLSSGSREPEYMQSEQTARRSVYDYIDTENLYKIKRPNLKESRPL